MGRTVRRRLRDDAGVALLVTLLVALAVSGLAAAAVLIGSNALLLNRYDDRQGWLEAAAEAGLEEARARVNGNPDLYPDSGYAVLESAAPVTGVDGSPLPGVRRSTYVGPTGIATGQYGIFGSVVVVVEDAEGNRAIRRAEIAQESFSKYAYFTNIEGNIYFGGGDQLFGPVHSNDRIKIHFTGATFHGPVTTASTIQGKSYATFRQGYTESGARIEMPRTADLNRLRSQAQAGNMAFVGSAAGGPDQATLRVEFLAIDLNGDGRTDGADEGFLRAYEAADPAWVTADVPADYYWNGLRNSRNCGHYHGDGSFVVADDHPARGPDSWVAAVNSSTRRCYLGGADSLFNGFRATDPQGGRWLAWPGPIDPRLAGRPDAAYLFPLGRSLNPSFKGVIFVDGKVAISGTLRSRVTVAATGNIIVADDITYVLDPATGTCQDILGLFSGQDIVVADNTLNTPTRARPTWGNAYRSFDETKDEFIHGFVLALNTFTVYNYAASPNRAEACERRRWGRGCLYLTGGVIQRQRGPVGTTRGTGYIKRYSYDACGATNPPPYFPTTGHFARGRFYEVDPVGFELGAYFDLLTAGP